EIILLVVNDSPLKTDDRRYGLYDLFVKFDHQRFGQHPDAFERFDLKTIFPDCPTISVAPQSKGKFDIFTQADIDKIATYELDVAIRFGFQKLQGKVLETARYGIWSYRPGVSQVNRADPPGFWEMIKREGFMRTIIEMQSPEEPDGRIIYQSYAGITNYSIARTLNRPLLRSASFTIRKLTQLYEQGPSALKPVFEDG
ncbi:MAG: hypothetical protein CUN57_00910, partial [Phototrophicales bacterium]